MARNVSFSCFLSGITALGLSSGAVAQGQSEDIEHLEVTGRAQQFYLDTRTKLGTKTDADLLDIPMSAQVLTAQLISDQAARDITDLYRSIAGVSEYSYSGVTFRGFRDDGNVFYDGVRGDPYSGFSVPDLFNVTRVEVLKGPATALYGSGEPGGMINYVTKKPTFNESADVNLTVGNYDLLGISAQATGGLSGTTAYRLGGFYEAQDSFRNNADMENIELAGGLLHDFSDDTRLTTTFDYIVQNLGGHRLRGVPVDDNGNFLVDRSYNANEESDFQDLEAWVVQSQLEHTFSDIFRVNSTLRLMTNERDQAYHESQSWVDVNGDGEANIDDETIRREYRDQHRANDEVSLTTDFVYDFSVAGMDHQLLFGGDWHYLDSDYDYLRARYEADGVGNLNIFELNYGETDPSTYNLTDQNRDGIRRNRQGLYLQDMIQLADKWTLMLGARFDHFDERDKESGYEYGDQDVTFRSGLTFKPTTSMSLYANYSESFNPVDATDQADASVTDLKPVTGDSIEFGVKNEWLDGSIMTTFAVYHISKENLVASNPDYIEGENDDTQSALINFGVVESDGAEFTLVGDITDELSITANYAYNDTIVVDGSSNNTFGEGDRFVNAPRHQAGLWGRYALHSTNSSVALGVNYVGEQISSDAQKVKAFTVFDASWTTKWDNILFSLNVNNVFDKEYAVSGFSQRNGHFPGQPREIIAQIKYDF
ncbi:TonB-dependent siderophore receptor [Paraglaciecola chathamensis]|uniref:TonB-dependent siderophore receptor n=1 Tax=Paraglaciecola chathamensis TaxID=368405 RepID=UPI002708D60F|nr:TonB-dependent siderophore receptor [Paraglaciecola chathamensis]MDO6838835.1 TonB-dependent siderophore receptor [Paraglaciecola chathamensis]